MLFIFFQRRHAAQFLHGSGHGRQRLPDFMSDRGGEPAERRHALFGGDFLFKPAKFRQVLEIKHEPTARRVTRT